MFNSRLPIASFTMFSLGRRFAIGQGEGTVTTRMPDTGSAELAGLLSRLSTQVYDAGESGDDEATGSSAGEAMALYYVTARIVELQLQLAERGDSAQLREEMATTRDLLEQTRRVLASALGETPATDNSAPEIFEKPRLSVVHGQKSRRRRTRKTS